MPNINHKGIKIEYEETGEKENPPVLLLMGAGEQLISWPKAFYCGLAEKGYRVIRLDYRDTGLSTKFELAGKPNIGLIFLRSIMGLPMRVPYTFKDVADDVAGLCRGLGITSTHIIGCSMGGMVAQILAAKHKDLTSTLTVMMSTTNRRSLPKPTWKVLRQIIFNQPKNDDREQLARYYVSFYQLVGSPAYPTPPDELREIVEMKLDRSFYPVGVLRHIAAGLATGDLRGYTRRIKAPSLIIHGKDDPLVRLEAGLDVAKNLPNATVRIYSGMGHDLPQQLIPSWIDIIDTHMRNSL
jgi:proline iminopeptidase